MQQIHFVPKSYFLQQASQQTSEPVASPSELEQSPISSISSDFTRNPRHLAVDRYYVGPASDQAGTATTSLRASTLDRAGNPINFNDDLDQELKLDISNNNPNNNQYEAKILPNSPVHQAPLPRKSSRGKSRRTKSRPPKNVIIYSLPEQSFYAAGNGETSYSEPDSRESSGLRSDIGDEIPEEQQQPVVADSKEFRTSSTNSVLSQKKALLGQCMAQCIDAILS